MPEAQAGEEHPQPHKQPDIRRSVHAHLGQDRWRVQQRQKQVRDAHKWEHHRQRVVAVDRRQRRIGCGRGERERREEVRPREDERESEREEERVDAQEAWHEHRNVL